MPERSETKPGTKRLSEVSRHIVRPSGIVSTEWSAVRAVCGQMGLAADRWQDGAGRLVLAKRADGSYAASIGGVVISIPRQVGKTWLIGMIVFALCRLHPGLLVIWTAHMLPTAGETFRDMQAMAKQPRVWPYIERVVLGSGDESVIFKNGSRILFGARERGFGLGFKKVGILVLDEAQRLTEKALDDLVPTTNQAENPLVFMMGTPPRPTDAGEVFKARRREALSGEFDDGLYIEISADPSVQPEKWANTYVDWKAVASANPSFPHRTPKSAILRMKKLLGPASFRREGLGIWDDDSAGSRLITDVEWGQTRTDVAPDGIRSFGVAFSADGERQSVGGVVKHPEGAHVELIGAQTGSTDAGVADLVRWFTRDPARPERWRTAARITISGSSHATLLWQALREAGVPANVLHLATAGEYFTSCSMLYDAVIDRTVTHPASEEPDALDASVAVCDKQLRRKDGAWGWKATTSDGDETPLEAVGLALWGARTSKRRPGRKQVAV